MKLFRKKELSALDKELKKYPKKERKKLKKLYEKYNKGEVLRVHNST